MAKNTEKTIEKKKRNTGLLKGAAVLAAGSAAAKLLGALYRVPLTNILGAEGMGMYQLIFPVFALFCVLSSAGIPIALSRIVAEKRSLNENPKKYLTLALTLLGALSAVLALLVFALSDSLAKWQGAEQIALGYRVIAPSLLFVGIIAGLRGWFQGHMYMYPTAISNVLEQLVKLSVGIALAIKLASRGVLASVCGALIGITVSEFAAFLYLVAVYFYRERTKQKQPRAKVTKEEASASFRIAFPIAIVALLLPLSSFFDSLIIVNMLKLFGENTARATADYGLLSGPVTSLVNMPVVLIMSLAVAIVPSVSASRSERDMDSILFKCRMGLKLSYAIGIPTAFFILLFSGEILSLLYPTLSPSQLILSKSLLLLTAPNIVLMSVMQIYVSLLQALDRTKYAVMSVGFAIIIKTVLSLVLVRFIGVEGAAVATLSLGIAALALTNAAFLKYTSLRISREIALCLVAGGITALCCMFFKELQINYIVAIALAFVLFLLIYVWLIILSGVFDMAELGSLPFRRVFLRLHRIIRFWEYGEKNET